MLETKEVKILSDGEDIKEILDEAEEFACSMDLTAKEVRWVRLLTEETMALVREITGEPAIRINFKGEGKKCLIHLEIDALLDKKVRDELIEISKKKRNESAKGVLGRIRDVIEQMMCMPDEDLAEEYVLRDTMMGTSSGLDFPGPVDMGMVSWTLQDYRSNIKNGLNEGQNSEEWDELEKSVVANLADDVRIGIKGTHVEVDVIKNFAG
ncbi:MAG: hypothetical protein K6B41_03590 [Butyrivibrio sp.]|nr:hypothetical protein [Butyrivibrio sp.]